MLAAISEGVIGFRFLEVFLHVVVEAPDSLEVLKEVLEVTVRFQ